LQERGRVASNRPNLIGNGSFWQQLSGMDEND
jgi:hypothetical protein